jgi:hypothetical protein
VRRLVQLAAILVLSFTADAVRGEWTRFRGPNGSGVSEAVTVPAKWTERDYNFVAGSLGRPDFRHQWRPGDGETVHPVPR